MFAATCLSVMNFTTLVQGLMHGKVAAAGLVVFWALVFAAIDFPDFSFSVDSLRVFCSNPK